MVATYSVLVVVPASLNPNTNGFAAYYTAARILIRHPRDMPRVYNDVWFQGQIDAAGFDHVVDIHNTQPPTMSLLMAALAWLSPAVARFMWVWLGFVLWIGGLALLGQSLGLRADARGHRGVLRLAASTTLFVPLADNFRHGQCYTLLFFLVCVFISLTARPPSRRDWIAGLPLGLMAISKMAGVWLWPLLLLSGRRRVLLGAAASAAFVAIASLPLIGWEAWRPFIIDLPRFLSDPVRYVAAYQTLTSLFGHLLVLDARWNPHPIADQHWLATALTLLAAGALFVISVRVQRLGGARLDERLLSLAMVTALIVSTAPIAESYHYVLVLPAVVIAFWWALHRRLTLASRSILAAAGALLVVPLRLYTASTISSGGLAILAYPRVYGALVLWGWLALNLKRGFDAPAVQEPEQTV